MSIRIHQSPALTPLGTQTCRNFDALPLNNHEKDINDIIRRVDISNYDLVLTTEKDGVKLALKDKEIGELHKSWNWLAIEYDENPKAKIIHYTLGTPCFKEFKNTGMSKYWEIYYKKLNKGHFKNG